MRPTTHGHFYYGSERDNELLATLSTHRPAVLNGYSNSK